MQQEWIGRSEGARVMFDLTGEPAVPGERLGVFTTRPETLFGASFCALSPHHDVVRAARKQVDATPAAARYRGENVPAE